MSTQQGQEAEALVARYLQDNGHSILARNWRNRWCEIDIVSSSGKRSNQAIHFIEVKYRRDDSHGEGMEYVTPNKIKQLKKAALHWITENEWQQDYYIDVASVDGESGEITYLENAVNS